jgi:hypothetical protein
MVKHPLDMTEQEMLDLYSEQEAKFGSEFPPGSRTFDDVKELVEYVEKERDEFLKNNPPKDQ